MQTAYLDMGLPLLSLSESNFRTLTYASALLWMADLLNIALPYGLVGAF